MSELIIKISANAKAFEDSVKDIKDKTKDLEQSLGDVAKVSGIAFAGLTAAAGVALKAFANQEKATNELTASLQNQGIASQSLFNNYRELATAVQTKTGIDDDAIVSGQALLQSFLGQQKISLELTQAMADLSERTGSVESAAQLLGRAISGDTTMLRRYGIQIDANLTKEERQAELLKQVAGRFGGMAEAANQGLGGLRGLQNALGDVFEEIGKQLAPAVSDLIKRLTEFFTTLSGNKPLLTFIVEIGKIAFIITGVITGLASGALAVIQFQKALAIGRAALAAFGISARVAVGATGIGLLLIIAAEIYTHWNTVWPAMQSVFSTFANNIGQIGRGIGLILSGVLVPGAESFDRITAGFEQLKSVVLEGYQAITLAVDEHQTEQTEKEIVQDEAKLERVRAQQAATLEEDMIFKQKLLVNSDLFHSMSAAQQQKFLDNNRKALQDAKKTEQDILDKAILDQANAQARAHERAILERQRFGAAVAEINRTMNSDEVSGLQQTIGQLSQLQQSKNSTLKSIGKAAAVTQITIDTAKGAVAAYTGMLAAIPFPPVSIPLGIAAAAAVVAFGAERIGNVVSAQEGGIVPGVSMGRDSIPSILEPGELVVPRANFSEVVNAVAAQRATETPQASSGVAVAGAGATQVGVEISFTGDDAEKFLTARQVEARSLGTLREASS